MITKENIDKLERLTGQLEAHHREIATLNKKSPVDAVNAFKLKFINATITESNALLGASKKPFPEFENFEIDDVPSNSDVTLILAQYLQAMENFRADNIKQELGFWYYKTTSGEYRTNAPAKLRDR